MEQKNSKNSACNLKFKIKYVYMFKQENNLVYLLSTQRFRLTIGTFSEFSGFLDSA